MLGGLVAGRFEPPFGAEWITWAWISDPNGAFQEFVVSRFATSWLAGLAALLGPGIVVFFVLALFLVGVRWLQGVVRSGWGSDVGW